MTALIRPAVSLFLLLTALTGVLYPLAVTGIAQVLFPAAASGSLIVRDGKPVGSALIGQSFTDPKYFWGRPSATSGQPYNGAASGGSNLGPLNPALVEAVKERIAALQAADPDNQRPIPGDLVTASGSGLDPHISPAAAAYQVGRVARARRMEVERVAILVARNTEGRQFGFLGEPRVNVFALNLALDTEGLSLRQGGAE
ncbi:potassium-transporting ATPase subunit KdpC [Thiocystis violascens]|uniref:Potassium-transporting ATPase KdpC subunit n=1 Tax=Thiocystis violascens (strain ATCC 17096 / DSM 198 / 6111) TaxID=765911 RepID=I3Y5A0_THIV6|nr:potassium-transporting ATPase subunit KdpC [Thiocystis violascens]AFL72168.1 K+-transporting ATPase, C subunit [Thiocystis violascens DSM 198]